MRRTHYNVVALNRCVFRVLRETGATGKEDSGAALGIDSRFCKSITEMSEERLESLVQAVNAPLLTGASISPSNWELFTKGIEGGGDMKHACAHINTVIRIQSDD